MFTSVVEASTSTADIITITTIAIWTVTAIEAKQSLSSDRTDITTGRIVEHTSLTNHRAFESTPPRKEMIMKKLILCSALAAFALGTQAASAAEFYIVRDATTKKCTIVNSKPTITTTTVVGDGVYKTKVEAESAIKTTKICTEH